MRSVLICPGLRPDLRLLAVEAPLATVHALGYEIVKYWMSHLACEGSKHVVVLAHDRPEQVRKAIGTGSRWGMSAEVVIEKRESLPEEAREKYGAPAWVMDHFPGFAEHPLFSSYEHWFKAVEAWMPRAATPDRVGVRESHPGIWEGHRCRISREAKLKAPCWLGDHVYVGAGAVIGPGAILENGSFIEPEAEIIRSIVGPATFVGQGVRISHALACGATLVDWQTGEERTVADSYLMCSLHPQHSHPHSAPLLDRVAEWLTCWKDETDMEAQALAVKR